MATNGPIHGHKTIQFGEIILSSNFDSGNMLRAELMGVYRLTACLVKLDDVLNTNTIIPIFIDNKTTIKRMEKR